MAQTGVIAHADQQGRRADYRASQAGYFYHRLGENLAAGQLTWERALHAWLNSPDHRANLLAPDYRELGIGFAGSATRYRTVWAQLLGARRAAYPVIINLDAYAADTPEVAVYVHGAREARAMRYRINDGAWSAWQSPTEWLECELPHREGFHTITVQIQIGERVFEASDEIYLQSGVVLAQVAGDGERDDARRTCLLEGASTGVECAARSEHIVQQPHGAPTHRASGCALPRMHRVHSAYARLDPAPPADGGRTADGANPPARGRLRRWLSQWAICSAWLNPRIARRAGWMGTGTIASTVRHAARSGKLTACQSKSANGWAARRHRRNFRCTIARRTAESYTAAHTAPSNAKTLPKQR
jgi:hypothetical protein